MVLLQSGRVDSRRFLSPDYWKVGGAFLCYKIEAEAEELEREYYSFYLNENPLRHCAVEGVF